MNPTSLPLGEKRSPYRGITSKLQRAGLATIFLISALWAASGSYFLRQADRAIQRRMTARQLLVLILKMEATQDDFFTNILLVPSDQSGLTALMNQHKMGMESIRTIIAQLGELSPPEDRSPTLELLKPITEYEMRFAQFIALDRRMPSTHGRWQKQWEESNHVMDRILEGMEPTIEALLTKAASESELERRRLFWATSFVLIMGFMVGGIVFYSFAVSITRPLIQLKDEVVQIGRGRLDGGITVEAPGEVGVLAQAFREMIQNVRLNQAAVIHSEKMAGIGQFAAGVAHDINNPIAVILGFAEGLMRRAAESDPLLMPYKSIEREALRCKALVQNLLAFSRGQGGGQSVMKPEDLNQVIEGALVLVATLARSKKVDLVRPARLEMPPIMVDGNQIQQVIINLCTNAMDAMPNGGTLTIGLANEAAGSADISVQDTGSGIPPEVRDHMFEAFFTTKEVGKGTGLGLSIISTIVKAHQGKIDVTSEVGKGTLFVIHLPREKSAAPTRDTHSLAA